MNFLEILNDVEAIILRYNRESRVMPKEVVQELRDGLSTYLVMLTDESTELFDSWIAAEDLRKSALATNWMAFKNSEEKNSVALCDRLAEVSIAEEKIVEREWRTAFFRLKQIGLRGTKVLDAMASRLHMLDKLNLE